MSRNGMNQTPNTLKKGLIMRFKLNDLWRRGQIFSKHSGVWVEVNSLKIDGQWRPIHEHPEFTDPAMMVVEVLNTDTITLGYSLYSGGSLSADVTYFDALGTPLAKQFKNYSNSGAYAETQQTISPVKGTRYVGIKATDIVGRYRHQRVTGDSVVRIIKWRDTTVQENGVRITSANLIEVPKHAPNSNDFHNMFSDCSKFNGDISGWNTSAVIDMDHMFRGCAAFNCDISNWDVSKNTDTSGMFMGCTVFNQPIGKWNMSNTTLIHEMFSECRAFNQDLSGWDVSNISNFGYLFSGCREFNGDVSTWNTTNAKSMQYMFQNCRKFNQDLSGWNTANVTTMHRMFQAAFVFNSDIGNWDVGNVTQMSYMFNEARSFEHDLSNWCVAKITNFPIDFDAGTPLFTTEMHPKWGTCPVR